MSSIGFIGVGIMGKQMIGHLIEGGSKVVIWNRTPSRCDDLVASGAILASSPAEVVGQCQQIFAMLSDPVAAEAVVFGPGGILTVNLQGKVYVDCSTLDAATNIKVSNAVVAASGSFLACPVSGGWREAKAGKLLLICSGDKAAYASIGSTLEVLSERSWFVGEDPGAAAQAKLGLQIMMGSFVGALSEAISVTTAAGIDQEVFTAMLGFSAMRNPLCTAKGNAMIASNYQPNFQVYLIQKDLRLALQLAKNHGLHTPITAAAHAQYQRATALGYGSSDFAAVKESCHAGRPSNIFSLVCLVGAVAVVAFQAGRKMR